MKIYRAALLGLTVTVGSTLSGCGRVKPAIAERVDASTRQAMEDRNQGDESTAKPDGPDYAQTLDAVRVAYRVVLNNIANAQTPGYRAVRPIFEDVDRSSPQGLTDMFAPVLVTDPRPGRPIETGRFLDVAIQGAGYFVVDHPAAGGVDGLAYHRTGRLFVNDRNMLVHGAMDGPPLEPVVILPDEILDIHITPDGLISGRSDPKDGWHPLGMIHLARFANENALRPVDCGCVIASAESGPPMVDTPGGTGLGRLLHMHLEGSNVNVGRELTELEHLKSWGHTLAEALGVDPGFRDGPSAAIHWGAAPLPPAEGQRLTAARR